MSSACISQYCSAGCCNYYGYCPTVFGSSLSTDCYYWYYWNYWWIYYVVASVAFVLIVAGVIGCVVYRRRRARQMNQDTIIINEVPQAYGNQYGNQYGNNTNTPNDPYPQNQYIDNEKNATTNAAYQMGQITTGNNPNQPYMGEPVYLANQGGNHQY